MLPLKKILCPTDFSEPSYQALEVANELALHFSAELFIVHVLLPMPNAYQTSPPAATVFSSFNIPLYRQELETIFRRSLDELVEKRVAKNVRVDPVIAEGDAPYQIIRVAEEEEVDLIVIATHGRTGFQRFLFGSVAEKVVRLAPCPVLTVPIQALQEEGRFTRKSEVSGISE